MLNKIEHLDLETLAKCKLKHDSICVDFYERLFPSDQLNLGTVYQPKMSMLKAQQLCNYSYEA